MIFPRLDIRSACLFITSDSGWRHKTFLGGLVLLIPVVGWTTLLGYRKVAIDRLWDNENTVLSDWKNNYIHFFIEGFKSCLVIFTYLIPASICFWYVIFSNNLLPQVPLFEIFVVLLIFPIFTPIALPLTILYLTFMPGSGLDLTTGFSIILFYGISVFWIPLGFLQVSITGRYLSAFDVPKTISFLRRNFLYYLEAWIDSSIISLVGHFSIPFSPWGVTWAYLAIVYNFNEVLYRDNLNSKNADNLDSWFDSFSGDYWESVDTQNKSFTTQYLSDDGRNFKSLNLGPFKVPLPRLVERLFSPDK